MNQKFFRYRFEEAHEESNELTTIARIEFHSKNGGSNEG